MPRTCSEWVENGDRREEEEEGEKDNEMEEEEEEEEMEEEEVHEVEDTTFINGGPRYVVEHQRCVYIIDEAQYLEEITVLLERDALWYEACNY